VPYALIYTLSSVGSPHPRCLLRSPAAPCEEDMAFNVSLFCREFPGGPDQSRAKICEFWNGERAKSKEGKVLITTSAPSMHPLNALLVGRDCCWSQMKSTSRASPTTNLTSLTKRARQQPSPCVYLNQGEPIDPGVTPRRTLGYYYGRGAQPGR
jgi:hypothetical protein